MCVTCIQNKGMASALQADQNVFITGLVEMSDTHVYGLILSPSL